MKRLAMLPLLLAACAPPAPPPPGVAWVGRSEAELVSAIGVPDRVHEVEGRRFLAYDIRYLVAEPTPFVSFGFGTYSGGWWRGGGSGFSLGFGGPAFAPAPTLSGCSTNYEVRAGQVIGVTVTGPGCA